jgi:hypothetical protein
MTITQNTINKSLEYFKVLPVTQDVQNVNSKSDFTPQKLHNLLAKGLVPTSRALPYIDWIKDYALQCISGNDLSKTFYRRWNDLFSRSEDERLADQLYHYLTTYGAESLGIYRPELVYLPANLEKNTKEENQLPVQIIDIEDQEKVIERAYKMLDSGMPLASQTVSDLLDILDGLGYKFTENKLANKEARARIASEKGVWPEEADDILRVLIYQATGRTLVIKDRETISALENSNYTLPQLSNQAEKKIATHNFNRHKKLLVAFKKAHSDNKPIINRIARKSKSLHQPQKQKILDNLTNGDYSYDEVTRAIIKESTFRVISALNAIRERLKDQEHPVRIYKIRNGKTFAKEDSTNNRETRKYQIYESILISNLLFRLKDQKIYIPSHIDYALPKSEKDFVGEIPAGSSFSLSADQEGLCIGVYWHEKNNIVDLDLSALTKDRCNNFTKVGWNSDWVDDDLGLSFSGDITRAPQGACEYLTWQPGVEWEALVLTNLFDGELNSSYYILGGYPRNFKREGLIQTENLQFALPMTMSKKQKITGLIVQDSETSKFYLYDGDFGNLPVSDTNGKSIKAMNALKQKLKSQMTLRELLQTGKNNFLVESPEDADIDLSLQNLNQDAFLNLFN